MERITDYDSLTGLLGCSVFRQDLDVELPRSQVAAVALVDLERFGIFNLRHGRSIGDYMLALQAERISHMRSDLRQLLYYLKGGRFLQIWLSDSPVSDSEIVAVAQRTQTTVARDVRLSGEVVSISCLVTCIMNCGSASAEQILQRLLQCAEYTRRHYPSGINVIPDYEISTAV